MKEKLRGKRYRRSLKAWIDHDQFSFPLPLSTQDCLVVHFYEHTYLFLFFVQECVFTKNFADTALHVYWTGTLRVHHNGGCKRWYFTFNGAECSTPLPIEGVVYVRSKTVNPHRVRHIEGYCNKIHKGKVRVGFWVGKCQGYNGNYDAYTGWNSVSRIFVEEVPKAQA